MSNIYFTSDTHFSHNRGFLYEPRGFSSIEEHDETIVENWNKTIKPEDCIFLLGDTMLNNNIKPTNITMNTLIHAYIRNDEINKA